MLITLVANEAYFDALKRTVPPDDPFRAAIIPAEKGDPNAVIESADPHDLLQGKCRVFELYASRLRQARQADGKPYEPAEAIARSVTDLASEQFKRLLSKSEEPYAELRNRLQNEAIGSGPQKILAGISISAPANQPDKRSPAGLPVTSPTAPEVHDANKSLADILESVRRIERHQQESGTKVGAVGSGTVRPGFEIHKGMFDRAKAMLDAGKILPAQTLFEETVSGLAHDPSPDAVRLRARAIGNIGHCFHRLGKQKDAVANFRDSHRLYPEHLRLCVNSALADLLENEVHAAEATLRAVLAENPDEPDVLELLGDCLLRTGRARDTIELLEKNPRKSESYYCVLANAYAKNGDRPRGIATAKAGIQQIGCPDYAEFTAGVLIAEEILDNEDGQNSHHRREVAKRLQEAAGHFERAVRLVRSEGNITMLRLYLSNLCAVYGGLNKRDDAIKAGTEALELGKPDHQLLTNLFAAQISAGKADEAVASARAIREFEPITLALTREIHALLLDDRYTEIIATFDSTAERFPEIHADSRLVALRIAALRRLPDAPAAAGELQAALQRFGRVFSLVLEEAHAAGEQRERDRAEQLYLEAEKIALGKERRVSRLECGLFYYRCKRFGEAIDRLVAPDEDPLTSDVLTEYLHCLHSLNRLPEVADIGIQAIKERRFNPEIWELTGWALAQIGRLTEAERVLRELVQQKPTERNHLELGGVCFRLYGAAKAIAVLESACKRLPESFYVQVNLSGLYFSIKEYRKAFDAARAAVKLKPDRQDGHTAMARLLLAGNRLKLNDEEAKLLHDSLERAKGVTHVNIAVAADGAVDASEMLDILKERREHIDQVLSLYRRDRLPLSILSAALNRDVLDTWLSIAHADEERFYLATGTTDEQKSESTTVTNAKEIVIDATALITLQQLGLLHRVTQRFSRIYVSNSLREMFMDIQRQEHAFDASTGTLGYHEGKIVLSENAEVARRAKCATLEPIIDFLNQPQITIEGIDAAGWEEWQKRKKVKLVPHWVLAPALLAKAKQCPFYCDEVGMRSIASESYGVNGFSTQAFLRSEIAHTGLDAYRRGVITLVDFNYEFISVSTDDIIWHLSQCSYRKSATFGRLLRMLEKSNYTDDHSIRILGQVAANIWFNTHEQSGTPRNEWMASLTASLNAAANRSIALMQFVSAAATGLIAFPEAYSAFCLHLTKLPAFSASDGALVRSTMTRIFALLPEQINLPYDVYARWIKMNRWFQTKQSLNLL